MSLSITGFGGIGEIGGNAFLLEDGKRRVFLDFGKQFGNDTFWEMDGKWELMKGQRAAWGDYFDAFLKPRTFSMVSDLMKLGILPSMPQNFRQDIGGSGDAPDVDAVILSHAHMDHAGLIPFLKPDIPIITSNTSRSILESIQTTSIGGAEFDFLDAKPRGSFVYGASGEPVQRNPKMEPAARAYPDKGGLPDGWDLETWAVDHSIHGAMATCIRTADGDVVYTGDFRMHGRQADETRRFVASLDRPAALVIEGTRVRRKQDPEKHETDEEAHVEAEILQHIQNEPGFVAIAYPPRDLDRLVSICNVAKQTDRILLISLKQAHLLQTLRAAGLDLPDPTKPGPVKVYLPAKERGVILHEPGRPIPVVTQDLKVEHFAATEEDWQARLVQDYKGYERGLLESLGGHWESARTVQGHLDKFLFSLSYWTITELFDIFEDPAQASGLYLHSQTQPFNDDMLVKGRKLERWLEAFHLRYAETHVSGHLSQDDLDWVLDEIRPKTVVPVHSMAPDVTAERYKDRTGQKAILPKHGLPQAI